MQPNYSIIRSEKSILRWSNLTSVQFNTAKETISKIDRYFCDCSIDTLVHLASKFPIGKCCESIYFIGLYIWNVFLRFEKCGEPFRIFCGLNKQTNVGPRHGILGLRILTLIYGRKVETIVI